MALTTSFKGAAIAKAAAVKYVFAKAGASVIPIGVTALVAGTGVVPAETSQQVAQNINEQLVRCVDSTHTGQMNLARLLDCTPIN